jgi:multidrug efflux pump subunit AcrB
LDFEKTRGESPEAAIIDACMVRLRPIMMTTFATVAGALPIVFGTGAGAESRRPLGLVIIGGLLFAQVITLFLTPVVYLFMDRWAKRLTWARKDPDLAPSQKEDEL